MKDIEEQMDALALWHAAGAGNGYYCHKCDAYRGS